MLTIEGLKALGADTDSGVARCVGNEEFYLKIVEMVIDSNKYDELKDALEQHDLSAAFDTAHALKGIVANASIDNLLKSVGEMTELLRAKKDIDYSELLNDMYAELDKLKALRAE